MDEEVKEYVEVILAEGLTDYSRRLMEGLIRELQKLKISEPSETSNPYNEAIDDAINTIDSINMINK